MEKKQCLGRLRERKRKRSPVLSVRRQKIKGFYFHAGRAGRIFGYAPGVYLCSFMEAEIAPSLASLAKGDEGGFVKEKMNG